MKSITLLRTVFIVAFLVAASIIPVQAQTADADSAAAASTVRAYHQALEAGDSQTILRLLASDALILENGDRETREEYREHHLQADIRFSQAVSARRSAVQVIVSGDVAWASSTSVTQGTYQKRPINLSGAELMVLSRTAAGWVIRAIHWSSRTLTSGN
jgi:ketosteroid isomerase-like protein